MIVPVKGKIPYLFRHAIWALLLGVVSSASTQTLISATLQQKLSKAQLVALVGLGGYMLEVNNGVSTYAIQYLTPHLDGELDTASGFLVIPDIPDQVWPTLIYQHGTVSSREEVPSRGSGESLITVLAAGVGYIALAPDYLGLGDSKGFHPYLHAATEASSARDLFLATRDFLVSEGIQQNGQVFITGYSQGGHAAMALHQEMEQSELPDGFTVTAAAPMSGPYSISGEMVSRLTSDEEYFFPGYPVYTMLSYNLAYELFDSVAQIINPPYVAVSEEFLEGEISLNSLHSQLIGLLQKETGKVVVKNIFQDSVIAALDNPDHPITKALALNDTYNFVPQSPTRLVYCMADDQVIFTNALIADSVMQNNNAEDVAAVDVNPTADHGGCVIPALLYVVDFFSQFQEITSKVDYQILSEMRMFPNPVQDRLWISGLPTKGTIEIFNTQGAVILRQKIQNSFETIEVGTLPSGMYFISVHSPFGKSNQKLVIE